MRAIGCLALLAFASLPQEAYAENPHKAPLLESLRMANEGVKEAHFYRVTFPDCFMGFEALSDTFRNEGKLLKKSPVGEKVSLANGTFKGFWILDISGEDQEMPLGEYTVRLQCGSGLGRIFSERRKASDNGSIPSSRNMMLNNRRVDPELPSTGLRFGTD